jgi:hypothetical protein
MILDDFYNADWPGVQEGFYRYFMSRGCDVAPFAYGNNKLFICKTPSHEKYLSFVENELTPFSIQYKRVEIGEFPVIHISLPGPDVVFDSNLRLISNIFSLRGPKLQTQVEFGAGWAQLQPNGIWTQGPRSDLRLRLSGLSPDPATLCINLEPFLHLERVSRRLSVTLNDCPLGDFMFDRTTPKYLQIPLPRGIVKSDCNLIFESEDPDRPSETIGTRDDRQLGFFFQQIRFA